jgi:hypothetical protein
MIKQMNESDNICLSNVKITTSGKRYNSKAIFFTAFSRIVAFFSRIVAFFEKNDYIFAARIDIEKQMNENNMKKNDNYDLSVSHTHVVCQTKQRNKTACFIVVR